MELWHFILLAVISGTVFTYLLRQLARRAEEIAGLNGKLSVLETLKAENRAMATELESYKTADASREAYTREYVSKLNFAIEEYQHGKEVAEQQRLAGEAKRLEELKKTWSTHERRVEEQIRDLCRTHAIQYVDKEQFPHRGKPDNSILVCEEHIVFDSKSPQGDDPSHFPTYIKAQAEAAVKYVKDGVRKDIYFVVPTNAAPFLSTKCFNLSSYRVYVVTEDALEPILLAVKKIEEYEFADKLDPSDRETICTILGKFSHAMKRRIQVEQFFSNEALALIAETNHLPAEFLIRSREVEKASKLNPPANKRSKVIDVDELKDTAQSIGERASGLSLPSAQSVEISES